MGKKQLPEEKNTHLNGSDQKGKNKLSEQVSSEPTQKSKQTLQKEAWQDIQYIIVQFFQSNETNMTQADLIALLRLAVQKGGLIQQEPIKKNSISENPADMTLLSASYEDKMIPSFQKGEVPQYGGKNPLSQKNERIKQNHSNILTQTFDPSNSPLKKSYEQVHCGIDKNRHLVPCRSAGASLNNDPSDTVISDDRLIDPKKKRRFKKRIPLISLGAFILGVIGWDYFKQPEMLTVKMVVDTKDEQKIPLAVDVRWKISDLALLKELWDHFDLYAIGRKKNDIKEVVKETVVEYYRKKSLTYNFEDLKTALIDPEDQEKMMRLLDKQLKDNPISEIRDIYIHFNETGQQNKTSEYPETKPLSFLEKTYSIHFGKNGSSGDRPLESGFKMAHSSSDHFFKIHDKLKEKSRNI